jgi:O-acetyl-ADP-ribose deacetylase (regulator of RNase III)/tellurite resistance protein
LKYLASDRVTFDRVGGYVESNTYQLKRKFMALQLMASIAPGLLQLFTSVFIPIAGELLKFVLPRLPRIPLYLRLLWTIYQDQEFNAEARKYLTSVLLLLGSILTFMVYSYIPWTGVPIVGAFTTPIAALMALVISLIALDSILVLNKAYLSTKYPEEFALVDRDINELEKVMGKSWDEMLKQTQALLDTIKQSIDPDGNYDDTILASINALVSYLSDPQSDTSLTPEQINRRIVTEGLPPLAKISGSVAEGVVGSAIVGTAAQGVAANMFVQAGLATSIKAAFGLASGMVVSAPVYSVLVGAAPIGLAIAAGAGVYSGAMTLRNEGEKQKFSAFLADVLIAALPIAWADDNFSPEERDTLQKLLLNPALNQKDERRILEAMEQQISFDRVLSAGLLKEENPQKARTKHRLLLFTAWELAKADGEIGSEEIDLLNRMAKLTNIMPEEVEEIRRLVLLKSGINIADRIKIIQGNITEQSVDAIVNSTNDTLMPGKKLGWIPLPQDLTKVDAAIHRAAGAELRKECQSLKDCRVGEAKMTSGYQLSARHVIHTVTPVADNNDRARELLAQCYRNVLLLAHQHSLRTIAFPALGTGAGKFSVEEAAAIAIEEVKQFLNTHFTIERVTLVCLDELSDRQYQQAVSELVGSTTNYLYN